MNMQEGAFVMYERGLTSLQRVLGIGREQAAGLGLSEAEMLTARLAPDMYALKQQAAAAAYHAEVYAARLQRDAVARPTELEPMFAVVDQRLTEASGALRALDGRPLVTGAEELSLQMGEESRAFTADRYVVEFALPNFLFHVSMGYAILRHLGVRIEKRDYLNL